MNDLENRLGDALDAAARTVPDTATGPGLGLSPTPRPVRRVVVVAIAAAAVVVAVAVPLAIRGSVDRGANPAGTGCPNPSPVEPSLPTSGGTAPYDGQEWADKLPAGPPPKVPYLVTSSGKGGYLQDGNRRIALATGQRLEFMGRAGCDWLVLRGGIGADREIAILRPDGSLRQYGRTTTAAAISPDRTKIAYVPSGTGHIVVVDLDSGRVINQLDVPAKTGAFVWTDGGIWYADEDHYHEYAHVWQPGSEPRKLTHDADEFLPVPGSPDLVVLGETQNGTCVDVLRLTPAALDRVMRHCGGTNNDEDDDGLVSPDGKLLITRGGKAYRIPENTATALDVRPSRTSLGPVAWEDDRHVLLETNIGSDNTTGRQTLVRCDAISGSCERIYDAQRGSELVIAELR